MNELGSLTLGDLGNFDVPVLSPCVQDFLGLVLEIVHRDNHAEGRASGCEREERRDVLSRGEDGGKLGMVDDVFCRM